jgi:hypothetical protein
MVASVTPSIPVYTSNNFSISHHHHPLTVRVGQIQLWLTILSRLFGHLIVLSCLGHLIWLTRFLTYLSWPPCVTFCLGMA